MLTCTGNGARFVTFVKESDCASAEKRNTLNLLILLHDPSAEDPMQNDLPAP